MALVEPTRRASLALALFLLMSPATRAETEAEGQAQRAAIAAFYPVMAKAAQEGRLDEAMALCRQAIEWEPNEPVHRYNLACIEAKAGRIDSAFEALEAAVAQGFREPDATGADPDLVALRPDPRFLALVTRMRGGVAPAPAAPGEAPPVPGRRPPAGGPGGVQKAPPGPPVLPANPAADPAGAGFVGGRPVGLYFMTRFWAFTGSLEKAAWYFAPDGRVYCNLASGFSAADLAGHPGRTGTARIEAGELVVAWSDGRSTASKIERDGGPSFMWDMGTFSPVQAFAGQAAAVGVYEGGESLGHGGGRASVAKSVELRVDGSYRAGSAASVSSRTDASVVTAGALGGEQGTWSLEGWSMTLAPAGGAPRRSIVFPFDDATTPIAPDWMFLGGTLYKRR